MYFYDAIAPIVAAESIDWEVAFRASRWGKDGAKIDGASDSGAGEDEARAAGGDTGVGDYVNCPLDRAQYAAFVGEVIRGRKVLPHEFEEPRYFESCMPIEVMAERGPQTLRFGPMRPIGLRDPRTGHRPWAVVQLRPENRYLTAYNLVGFQTRLAYPEQQRIFAMVPALAKAEWLRFGSIHRNTYVDAPVLLDEHNGLRARPGIFLAGQITGVEGYVESTASGLLTALAVADLVAGRPADPPPETTALGGLWRHARGTLRAEGNTDYSPSNIMWSMMPPVDVPPEMLPGKKKKLGKTEKRQLAVERARRDLGTWLTARA
jgi:methylenetetrahydrofolate--tRNA-(uracil-5-)-methyltransferase